jgi:hypothetical protein
MAPIVHVRRDGDLENALGFPQEAVDTVAQSDDGGNVVELLLRHGPHVVGGLNGRTVDRRRHLFYLRFFQLCGNRKNPRKTDISVAKSPERDYSHRSLFEKIGVKAQARAALVGRHDEAFVAGLNAVLETPASKAMRAQYDMIFLRVDGQSDLARIAGAVKHLYPAGALWVFHPKGRGADPSDAGVRAAGLAAGLVDNKICAYTGSHTATRFVIPLARR